jgi:hypothetical protein
MIREDMRKRREFLSLATLTIRKKPKIAKRKGKNAVRESALFTAKRLEKRAKIVNNRIGMSKDVLRNLTDFSESIFTT